MWKWINDNGDIYLKSKAAIVIIHNYKEGWDIGDFEEHSDIIPLIPLDNDLILMSAWRFFVFHEIFK